MPSDQDVPVAPHTAPGSSAAVPAEAPASHPAPAGTPLPQKPSMGRIVLYGYQGRAYSAIVCDVGYSEDGMGCEVFVFWPRKMNALQNQVVDVPFAEKPSEGCWSWPTRA